MVWAASKCTSPMGSCQSGAEPGQRPVFAGVHPTCLASLLLHWATPHLGNPSVSKSSPLARLDSANATLIVTPTPRSCSPSTFLNTTATATKQRVNCHPNTSDLSFQSHPLLPLNQPPLAHTHHATCFVTGSCGLRSRGPFCLARPHESPLSNPRPLCGNVAPRLRKGPVSLRMPSRRPGGMP